MSDNPMIKVEDLKIHYDNGKIKALDGITTEISKGEVVVVDQNFGVRITKIVLPEKRV